MLAEPGLALRVEDDLPQDGRHDGGVVRALLADGRVEEARDDVLVAAGELRLHERLCELVVDLGSLLDGLAVLAAGDDLLVVDRQDRQPVTLGEQVRERVEVGHDGVRLKVDDLVEVGRDVGEEEAGGRDEVSRDRAVAVHRVVDVADGEPLDLDHVREALGQEGVSAPAHDDLHLVPAGDQVLARDLAPGRVPHPLARHSVENPHGTSVRPSGYRRVTTR